MNQQKKQELIESLNAIHKKLLNKKYKSARIDLGLMIGLYERSINSKEQESKILNERNSVDEGEKSSFKCGDCSTPTACGLADRCLDTTEKKRGFLERGNFIPNADPISEVNGGGFGKKLQSHEQGNATASHCGKCVVGGRSWNGNRVTDSNESGGCKRIRVGLK